MTIAITGASGFVGRHLAHRLAAGGHAVVAVARGVRPRDADVFARMPFVPADLSNVDRLAEAFAGCAAVAHCAGINREIGDQTFQRVHIDGTRHVVEAARRAGVRRIAIMSFLRARPDCGSPYHESKWAAEEIVRGSGMDHCVIKAGMTYGRGDHMLDHLSHTLYTLPIFASVGLREQPIRPLAIDDLVDVLEAALLHDTLARTTIALTGPEQLTLSTAARRVARVIGRRVLIVPAPLWFHRALSQMFEWTMRVPLVAKAQVRMLAEGIVEPATRCDALPPEFAPRRFLTDDRIRAGLPEPGRFTRRDLRLCSRSAPPRIASV